MTLEPRGSESSTRRKRLDRPPVNSVIGFVVLNYNSYALVVACVDRIIAKVGTPRYSIAIVDNSSPDRSGSRLARHFKDHPNVSVLQNESNAGYARGNNLGYTHLRDTCGFICIINPDCLIETDDFYIHVRNAWLAHDYGVLGPRIHNLRGQDAPVLPPPSHRMLSKERAEVARELACERLGLLALRRALARDSLKRALERTGIRKPWSAPGTFDRHFNNVPLGCCLVFSPTFRRVFNKPFDPRTFLYYEETLLHIAVRGAGLTILYEPSIVVQHSEGASTGSGQSVRRTRMFQATEKLASLAIVLDMLPADASGATRELKP